MKNIWLVFNAELGLYLVQEFIPHSIYFSISKDINNACVHKSYNEAKSNVSASLDYDLIFCDKDIIEMTVEEYNNLKMIQGIIE